MAQGDSTGAASWVWRRSLALVIVGVALWRLSAMENAPDTRVNDTIAWTWGLLIFSIYALYAGFATADNLLAVFVTKSALPYSPASSPADPAVVAAGVAPAAPAHPLGHEFPIEEERRAG
jgi:hypothetical protein